MSLDFALLDMNGEPETQASIDSHTHHRLLERLGSDCPLLRRMADYYEDVTYARSELPSLKIEIIRTESTLEADSTEAWFMRYALAIVEAGIDTARDVHVIAD